MKKIFTFSFLCLSAVSMSAQTNCDNAPIVTPGITAVTLESGSQLPSPNCINGDIINKGAWYKYMPTEQHTTIVTTAVTGIPITDTRLHVLTGSCGALTCIAGDDDSGEGYSSLASFTAEAGTTYYIVFDDRYSGEPFSFSLTEQEFVPPPPPPPSLFTAQNVFMSGMCVTDMNGDYLDDIVSPGSNSVGILYQNMNTPGFTQQTLTTPTVNHTASWSIAAGDYDKNGYNDLLYGGDTGATIVLANNNGNGFDTKLESTQYIFSQRTNFIDINNDGNLDAFVCHDVQPNVYFLNNGSGGFTFHQGGLGDYPSGGNYGSIWVDYDNDGDSDLFIAKCRGGGDNAAIDELHRNDGNGTYTTISSASVDTANMADMQQSWSSAWADYDNDGDMDAFVGASSFVSGGHRLKMNNSDGTFTDVAAGSGVDVNSYESREHVAHDFNNDGWVDIFSGDNTIFFNNGDMTFSPVDIPNASHGPIGDLNNDGFLDILAGNMLYLNNGNDNNWIKIHLEGVESNRNGIGARVEVYTSVEGIEKQIRDIRSGDGFKYMSSLNAHFGLGTAETIEKVIVRWPSGTVDTLLDPAINEPLMVTEGEHVLANIGFNTSMFGLYPNPARDVLNISGDNKADFTKASIYDLSGKLVKSLDINNAVVPVQSFAKGTYIIILQDNTGKQHTSKFIKG